ncbi:MAG TPA: ATP-binding protein [Xanthobacteraceae bacterium]
MTESPGIQNGIRLETVIPNGAASLESILRTEELLGRRSRLPDHEKENSALAALVGALADSPRTILQTLSDKVLDVLEADSAGLSLLTKDNKRFYWAAIAGAWQPHAGGGTPRDFGPCGDVLDRNVPMLFTHWERRYPYLGAALPLAEEGLLVPFLVKGRSVGTIWAIAHNGQRKFDREDLRLLESMGRFASAAYQTVESIEDLKVEIAAREKAESELRELAGSLEAQVTARTEDLEQRNRQLADARALLAEEKLQLERSEAFLARAQGLSRTGSWHLSLRTGTIAWSRELATILGFESESESASDPLFLQRIHPEDRFRVDQIRSAAITERKDYDVEYRLCLPGVIKHVHAVGNYSASDSGDPEYIGAVMDITERKRAEEDLRRSEAFLAQAQRLSRTGSFSWRVATDEIACSAELHRIFALDTPAPVTLEAIRARIHPEDMHLIDAMILHARADARDFEYEPTLQMPDGSIKYLHLIAHGVRDQDGRLEYIGSVQDVTQRRLSEDALAKARTDLAHVSRVSSLGVLTASIAHEVNQPLSGIVTNASTCLRMLGADPPNVEGARETARRTIRDGNRASEVISRLRSLFANKGAATESVDLNEATREVIALSSSRLQRDRAILRTELADDLPPVSGDRVQLQQVILNLLQNALDAMSTVDDRPRQLVVRTERDEGDRVRLTVQDAGVGFGPQVGERLFEAFYTTKSDGMGIGLSVSRAIIERHRGRLWAAPNDGPGAAVAFSIPCVAGDGAGRNREGIISAPVLADAERVMRSL